MVTSLRIKEEKGDIYNQKALNNMQSPQDFESHNTSRAENQMNIIKPNCVYHSQLRGVPCSGHPRWKEGDVFKGLIAYGAGGGATSSFFCVGMPLLDPQCD